ncbi:MAG: glycosyltransferase family 2 protein [Pseudomonadota bacterium]
MIHWISDGLTYLLSQSGESLLGLFWFVAIFEVPRYLLGFLAVAAVGVPQGQAPTCHAKRPRVTAIIAGHNEEQSIERCVRCLHEQSQPPDQIVVLSDGSTDRMPTKLRELKARGLIDEFHCTELRSGKPAGFNLTLRHAAEEIVVNVDCDCTFDRYAIENIVAPFADPEVAGVSGNIVARNGMLNLVTGFQAVEYLITISQGKQAADLIGQVTCVSGGFGAFRSSVIRECGGLDAGGGEDLDATLRLRKSGWKTVFAQDALCYTDVPDTLGGLVRQRFRWERDAVRLRFRKHRDFLNPFSSQFSWSELFHQIDFLVFNIAAAVVFPIYVLWLSMTYGDLALIVLLGAQAGMMLLDFLSFLLAALVTPRLNAIGLIPYVPGYSLFNGFLMRFVRLGAYLDEWIFYSSYQDTYIPQKVHRVRR